MSAGRHERDDCQVCKAEEPMMVVVVAGGGDLGNDVMLKDATRIQPGGTAPKRRCIIPMLPFGDQPQQNNDR